MTATSLELMTVPEAARRIGACSMTLRRRIERAGIAADAFLVEGSSELRSPLFVASRLTQLASLIITPHTKVYLKK
jgi:hypothetical protein